MGTQPIAGLAVDENENNGEDAEEEDGDQAAGQDGGNGFEGDEWQEGEVERGMLHALVELGHLEMLLHQVFRARPSHLPRFLSVQN